MRTDGSGIWEERFGGVKVVNSRSNVSITDALTLNDSFEDTAECADGEVFSIRQSSASLSTLHRRSGERGGGKVSRRMLHLFWFLSRVVLFNYIFGFDVSRSFVVLLNGCVRARWGGLDGC